MNDIPRELQHQALRAPDEQKKLPAPRDGRKREKQSIIKSIFFLIILLALPAFVWMAWFGGQEKTGRILAPVSKTASTTVVQNQRVISITLRGIMALDRIPGSTHATVSCHVTLEGISGEEATLKGEVTGPDGLQKSFEGRGTIVKSGVRVSFDLATVSKGMYACTVTELTVPGMGVGENVLDRAQRVAVLTVK